MYVSPAVRRIREDPDSDASVSLVLRLADDADPEAVARRVREAGWTVDRELRFDALVVTVPESSVGAVCALPGLAAVETDDVHATTLDGAGEDVEY